jgi:hypothetical protein
MTLDSSGFVYLAVLCLFDLLDWSYFTAYIFGWVSFPLFAVFFLPG